MSVIFIEKSELDLIASMLIDGQPQYAGKIHSMLEAISEQNAKTYNKRYKTDEAKRHDVLGGNKCRTREDVKRALRLFNDLISNTIGAPIEFVCYLQKRALRVAVSEF